MNVLVIVGHPSAHSFNHAIALRTTELLKKGGHKVWFHDLYKEGFDPLLLDSEISRDAKLDELTRFIHGKAK